MSIQVLTRKKNSADVSLVWKWLSKKTKQTKKKTHTQLTPRSLFVISCQLAQIHKQILIVYLRTYLLLTETMCDEEW